MDSTKRKRYDVNAACTKRGRERKKEREREREREIRGGYRETCTANGTESGMEQSIAGKKEP